MKRRPKSRDFFSIVDISLSRGLLWVETVGIISSMVMYFSTSDMMCDAAAAYNEIYEHVENNTWSCMSLFRPPSQLGYWDDAVFVDFFRRKMARVS